MAAMNIGGLEVGSWVRAAGGFAEAGDAVVARECGGLVMLAVIDVLGHGPGASTLARRIEALLEETPVAEPVALARMLHAELAGTLGAAAGIAALDAGSGSGRYAGIGNTVARVLGGGDRRLVSVDGVLGQRQPGVRPVEFRLELGETLVMNSDGVTSRGWDEDYPSLALQEPAMVAREVVRRFGKTHDDAACLAARRVG